MWRLVIEKLDVSSIKSAYGLNLNLPNVQISVLLYGWVKARAKFRSQVVVEQAPYEQIICQMLCLHTILTGTDWFVTLVDYLTIMGLMIRS